MRIAFFTENYYRGGLDTFLINLINHWPYLEDYKNHNLRAGLVPSDSIIAEKVNCISFEDLLEKNEIKKIDLLLVDTEGYDAEIILNLDFRKVKPSIIRFEHGLKHGHMADETFLSVTRYLNQNGYQLIAESYDATAYLLNPADFK